MRETKFRAWDKIRRKWLSDWEFNGITPDGQPFMTTNLEENEIWPDTEVVQYTGLKDKNGVEIYEGDIAQGISSSGDPITGRVAYDDGVAITYLADDQHGRSDMLYMVDDLEVISNIYEHPELLKEVSS